MTKPFMFQIKVDRPKNSKLQYRAVVTGKHNGNVVRERGDGNSAVEAVEDARQKVIKRHGIDFTDDEAVRGHKK